MHTIALIKGNLNSYMVIFSVFLLVIKGQEMPSPQLPNNDENNCNITTFLTTFFFPLAYTTQAQKLEASCLPLNKSGTGMILMHTTGTNSGTYFLIVTQSLTEPLKLLQKTRALFLIGEKAVESLLQLTVFKVKKELNSFGTVTGFRTTSSDLLLSHCLR